MTGESVKQGLVAALAALGAGELPAEAEQDELFDAADAPRSLTPAAVAPGRRRGPNKRTEQWISHLLSKYQSPLVGLFETYSRTPRALAEELEMFRRDDSGNVLKDQDGKPMLRADALVEAFRIQEAARIAALPYIHQKLPQAVTIVPPARGLLVLGELGQADASAGFAIPFAPEQNQRVIEGEVAQSDGEQSDGEAKPMDRKEE